ncbi:MAG: helicase-related protein [Vampirovibrionales bacterium]|nr:helicase-related protein [Vampirovibrionales bacterium]
MNKIASQKSDLKFFTNTDTDSLYQRFISTLKGAQFFDVLVGYFRTSGFYRLYADLESVEAIRILIGLSTDRKTIELYQEYKTHQQDCIVSHQECKKGYSKSIQDEMDQGEDSIEVEIASKKFIEFLRSGKMQLKAHPSKNIHAKVYITRFHEDDRDFGRVITGSSNFSENGLIAQREFNVELKDRADVEFACQRFEELWAEAVDVSEDYIDTVQNKTWLNDRITPYQIYMKFLYEYFKEDINQEEDPDLILPDGFMELAYQKQAVISAKKILDAYNGVFLSDVVGLGKTFITALLMQKLPHGRKLIICPPVMTDYWSEALHLFYVPGFDVVSLGKLDAILEKGADKYQYVIIDEAHRFRNEMTQGYEALHKICKNKKVILVSATPLNNKLADIKTQLKLFQNEKNSLIPGVPNLEKFFNEQQKKLDKLEKGTPEYLDMVKATAEQVRDKVLKHVMVRRTRSEIKRYFTDDITKQELRFPDMADPQRIVYSFDPKTERIFTQTVEWLKLFTYARYTPLIFLKKPVSEFDQQSQRNVGGFMKGILVKRLESSFYAFRKSLERFILSYQKFIGMVETGTVWISNKKNVFDLLDADDEAELLKMVDEGKARKYAATDFADDYKAKLAFDLELLERIQKLWTQVDTDSKLEAFTHELKNNPLLARKKVLVFSESKETVTYLQEHLNQHFPDVVLSFSSSGGKIGDKQHEKPFLRAEIEANYQPKHANPKDTINILLTTDVLAEGINLHRSNVIINYDLPWNPTRVLQRVGRVNRIGTQHDRIYVFNIFPTAQSDEHLGLEDNIKAKLQAFHNILGEDARYLSDDEEISTHELFGERFYDKVNDKVTFEDEDSGELSELYYLKEIRTLRDQNPKLFVSLKSLPRKARTAKQSRHCPEQLLTFFRQGRLKKFVISKPDLSQELTFLQAAQLFECKPETLGEKIPTDYFLLLQKNKDFLQELTTPDRVDMHSGSSRGASNEAFIIKVLKACIKFDGYTDEDETFIRQCLKAFERGGISKNASKKLKQALEKNLNPLPVLHTLRQHLTEHDIEERHTSSSPQREQREVILSEYLTAEGGSVQEDDTL